MLWLRLPGVLLGPCALALLRSAAQSVIKETKVKQELQGSVLSHGEHSILQRMQGEPLYHILQPRILSICVNFVLFCYSNVNNLDNIG